MSPKPKPSELLPPDWGTIEKHYTAGIQSVRAIARTYGVSHTAVHKKADQEGWTRSLKPQVLARAEELVASTTVDDRVYTIAEQRSVEENIEINAQVLAIVMAGQRSDIKRARDVLRKLMLELEVVIDQPELVARVHSALEITEQASFGELKDLACFVSSLPERAKTMKVMTEALHKLIGLEREAYGLATAGGSDGVPTAVIKDYTGKGDPDAPQQPDDEA